MSGVPQAPDADENGAQAIQGNNDSRGAACHRPSELRVRPSSRTYLPDLNQDLWIVLHGDLRSPQTRRPSGTRVQESISHAKRDEAVRAYTS